MRFTADHSGFYHTDQPFFPQLQEANEPLLEKNNVVILSLPARLQDDLDWSSQKEEGKKILEQGKYLLWELDLGLNQFVFAPHDSAAFFSFCLALEEFTTQILPLFQEKTFGVILYRGGFQPETSFPRSVWESTFTEWQEGRGDYPLFCAQTLAEYLHRLGSVLPVEILPFVFFDVSDLLSAAKTAQLFSKERFAYLHLILKGAKIPFQGIAWERQQPCSLPPLGLYLPKDPYLTPSLLNCLDELISKLSLPFRVITEEKLTEEWNDLDLLIVPTEAVTLQGKRKLQGFCAAGGVIACLGPSLSLSQEISVEEILR